ncbi:MULTISPECIES: hypothetical protein [unclassified Aureispira]|uniref:hypothetical protein n=1 Tax=unclassified Aureispira TaxID=2649989 RepID=UPI00069803F4|nr:MULTISPECIES: hypothetical protein [unclassified Aureispira]WMX17021.1 hypothetical protein QP953_11620 [Aureispira sp. CCB-E]
MKRRLKNIFILHEYIDDSQDVMQKYSKKVYKYMYTSPVIALEGLGTSAVRTDGVWTWSDSIVESYKGGKICLPKEFVDHVNTHLFSYPLWFAFKEYILRYNLRDEVNLLINEKIEQNQNK